MADRHHSWRLQINDRFAKLEEDELDKTCNSWIVEGTYWLQSIVFNIDFATKLFRPDEWDPRVLEDFVNLLAFNLALFLEKKWFAKAKEHCSSYRPSCDEPVLNGLPKNGEGFDRWLSIAKKSFRIFEDKHQNGSKNQLHLSLQKKGKLSGATFNELLFRNTLQRQRSNIVSRPKETPLQDTKDVRNVDLKAATEVIGMLTYMAIPMVPDI